MANFAIFLLAKSISVWLNASLTQGGKMKKLAILIVPCLLALICRADVWQFRGNVQHNGRAVAEGFLF